HSDRGESGAGDVGSARAQVGHRAPVPSPAVGGSHVPRRVLRLMGTFRLTRSYHFSAGHCLENPELGEDENARIYGQCYRQHGHNYLLEVTVDGALDPVTGMSADLGAVDAAVQTSVLSRVDHSDLSATVHELGDVIT